MSDDLDFFRFDWCPVTSFFLPKTLAAFCGGTCRSKIRWCTFSSWRPVCWILTPFSTLLSLCSTGWRRPKQTGWLSVSNCKKASACQVESIWWRIVGESVKTAEVIRGRNSTSCVYYTELNVGLAFSKNVMLMRLKQLLRNDSAVCADLVCCVWWIIPALPLCVWLFPCFSCCSLPASHFAHTSHRSVRLIIMQRPS